MLRHYLSRHWFWRNKHLTDGAREWINTRLTLGVNRDSPKIAYAGFGDLVRQELSSGRSRRREKLLWIQRFEADLQLAEECWRERLTEFFPVIELLAAGLVATLILVIPILQFFGR